MPGMRQREWDIIEDRDYVVWFDGLPGDVQDSILVCVGLLAARGPSLGRPHVDTLKNAPMANLKELRVKHRGEPWRILFAFDRQRRAVLLAGGSKRGQNERRWYATHIAVAAERAKNHDFDV